METEILDQKDQECLVILKRKIADDNNDQFKNSVSKLNDEYLLRFVRGKKHNIDKALKALKNNIHTREVAYKDFFDKLKPSKVKHVLSSPQVTIVLKERDVKGRMIGLFSPGNWDPNEFDGDDIMLTWVLQVEELWKEINIQRYGLVLVSDLRGFGLKHLKQFCNLRRLNLVFNVFLNSYPVRIKSMHYIDPPMIYDIVLKLSSAIMPAKLRSRLFTHYSSDWSTMHKLFSPEILPLQLGGKLSLAQAADLEVNRRILAEENIELELNLS